MSISAQDRARIATAIRAVEAKTSGEIVCVLAHASAGTTALPVFIAAVAALALPWLLVATTDMAVDRILSLQVVVFLGLMMLFALPRVRVALMPNRTRRAIAHRNAREQFDLRGVAHTKDRTGVLIFVSLAEHYARIIADEGIAARVPQSRWQGAVDALVTHMRDGRIADGFVTAIERCGDELASHFPRQGGDRDELANRIYLI